jgi:SAM-dependent methyltransferase
LKEAERPVTDRSDRVPAPEGLPDAYADWRRSTLGRITDTLEERLLLERIGPARDLRVLDVGCGDGVLATRLAQGGARVTGVDASADMIAAARSRAKAAGVDVDLVEGDAGNLPFLGGHFDSVVSVATLCFVDNPRRAVGEMARVLKPGGRLVLGELGRWNLWAAQRRVKGWLGSDLWHAAHFRSRSDLRALATDAGLEDATVAGAVFYPPFGWAAEAMASIDPRLGRWTTLGAAFLVLSAANPSRHEPERSSHECRRKNHATHPCRQAS